MARWMRLNARRAVAAALALALTFAYAPDGAAQEKETPLFDGKTFDGWEGNLEMFRIEDGAIVSGTLEKPIPHNEFLCTKREFANFELRLKVMLKGENANAGVQFRTKRIPDHHEVSGFQADMGWTYWGALYDESRRNKVLAQPDKETLDRAYKPNEWNEYVIRAEGPRIQLFLNGIQTVDYTEQDPDIPATGVVAVQIHGGPPSEGWYKDIVIRELD